MSKMKTPLKWLQRLRSTAVFKTLYFNFKTRNLRSLCVLIYPKSYISVSSDAEVIAQKNAQLKFGCRWEQTGYSDSSFSLFPKSKLILNGNFRIQTGAFVVVNQGAVLELGSGFLNNQSEIACFKSIKIGDNVAISKRVVIRDSDNHILNNNDEQVTQPIEIGDHVWIGLGVTILKGVKIGSGSVIAAGAIVNKDIPENCLAGGVPAKVIKTNINWK